MMADLSPTHDDPLLDKIANLFPSEVQQLQTVEASSPMEISDTVMNELLPLNVSSQTEQLQEITSAPLNYFGIESMEEQRQSIPDHSGHNNVHLDEMTNNSASLQAAADIQRINHHEIMREAHQLRQTEVNEEAIEVTDSTQLQIGEMVTTNERSPLGDSTQMEQVSESDTVQISTEKCSKRGDIIALSNASIDVEVHNDHREAGHSVQLRKIDAKQIASDSEPSKATPKNLQNTRLQNTRKKSQTHFCGECNKRFNSKSHLIRHSRIHTGEKPYVCADCAAAFTDSSSFKRHQRIHSGERPYVCADCAAAFTNSSDLKRHQRIHSDEGRLMCDICKKSFRLKRELSFHMDIHSGKKSHKCNVCKKQFRRRLSLKKHLQIHSK